MAMLYSELRIRIGVLSVVKNTVLNRHVCSFPLITFSSGIRSGMAVRNYAPRDVTGNTCCGRIDSFIVKKRISIVAAKKAGSKTAETADKQLAGLIVHTSESTRGGDL